jgi:molecular chaperone GrpE
MTNESTVAEMPAEDTTKEVQAENGVETTATVDATAEQAAETSVSQEGATDGTGAEETAASEPTDAEIIESLRGQLAASEARADELLDKLQRTAAEFQNSRRRQEKQLADEIERASSHILQRLLPVVDDLELAFGNLPAELDETQSAWLDGFRQIRKKLESLLEDQGVTAVAAEGPFDPSRHEAVSSEPNETVESGHIIQTLRTGYEYKGRVMRPALVRVAM